MDFKKYILLLSLLIRLIKCDRFFEKFIRDYFDSIYIYQLVFFGCWPDQEVHNLTKNLMQLDTKISYNEISDDLNLKTILRLNFQNLGVILDYDCPNSDVILDQFSSQLVFNESYYWVLLSKSLALPRMSLRDLPLSVASEMTLAIREYDTYKLYDVYNPSYRHGGLINITYMGNWTLDNKLINNFAHQYKYNRRQNFNLLPLNFSVVVLAKPFPDLETYLTTPINRHVDTMSRYNYQLILQLKDFYNFTINLKRDVSWGYKINGSFDGIIGDMVKGIVDISATPFQVKSERFEVCEYTVNVLDIRSAFIFRHPPKNDLQNGFLKPFDKSLWFIVLGVAGVYWFVLFLTTKAELYVKGSKIPDNSLMSLPATETSLITMAALFQQGASDGPRIISGRIAFLSLFLWTLLLYQFYSATIVGFLLAPPARWITTLKNLTDSSLSCAMEDMPYHKDFFATTDMPLALELYEKKIKPTKKLPQGSYYSDREGMRKVRDEGIAFSIDTGRAYKIIQDTFTEDQICELQEIPIRKPRKTFVGTAKHSPFKKMTTYGIRKILEHGLAQRLKRLWIHKKPTCPESHSSKPMPVLMKEFYPALLFLSMGFALSLLIFFIECIYHSKFDQEPNETDNQSITAADETEEREIKSVDDYDETLEHVSA